MNTTTILSETIGGVAVIKLNRPNKFHSFNREMALGLQEALDTAKTDDAIRCLLITAEGKAFAQDKIWPRPLMKVVLEFRK